MSDLVQEAQTRWLKPAEVLSILQNYGKQQLADKPPQMPTSGSLFMFNKRVLRNFRKDGHSWRRKKDGRTVGEAHERLKVGNTTALNCYYAHGDQNPNFQRRCYWMLDPAYDHIVLVHYRDITEGTEPAGGSVLQLSPGSSSNIESPSSYTRTNGFYDPYQMSPASADSSGAGFSSSITQTLRRLEEQLSLNDENLEEVGSLYDQYTNLNNLETPLSSGPQDGSDKQEEYSGGSNEQLDEEFAVESRDTFAWVDVWSQQKQFDANGMPTPLSMRKGQERYGYFNSGGGGDAQKSYTILPQQREYPTPPTNTYGIKHCTPLANQAPIDNSNIVGQNEKFTVREIFPGWGYAYEATKVVVIGCFEGSSGGEWKCMFGETEVGVEIMQEGVICCEAPPGMPGKVGVRLRRGNGTWCSSEHSKEFEYRVRPPPPCESKKSPEEVLLLVRFVQMLLSESHSDSEHWKQIKKRSIEEESWGQAIESVLMGSKTSGSTIDWLLQQLLKDKMDTWLSYRDGLSKKEQGIIHVVCGLGYMWALNPLLSAGVHVDFRDINGWTALHWAARFGREEMVGALVASGASAGAVTDPNSQDPLGKTPASVASVCGHHGLAAYLSELALNTHLSSLKITAAPQTSQVLNGDDLTETALSAVRNAAQAAARIQSAFRAHSFKRSQSRTTRSSSAAGDSGESYEYEIRNAASKMAFHNPRDYNTAAVSIQKKYRGWKGRKDFLDFRHKVVKIQAHVRGHQVRKNDKVIWAVGVLEKVVLRWRRGGAGLRGYRHDSLDTKGEDYEEMAKKMFRKQKVDVAIDEAVSRVMSMVKSEEARQQYHRMLQTYHQAKADVEARNKEIEESCDMVLENEDYDDLYYLLA
jgi:hypothetical protein